MTELISRQMALDRIDKTRGELLALGMVGAEHILVHYGRRVIEELPPIEPKRGRWEDVEEGEDWYTELDDPKFDERSEDETD